MVQSAEDRFYSYTFVGMHIRQFSTSNSIASAIRKIAARYIGRYIPEDFEGPITLSCSSRKATKEIVYGTLRGVIQTLIALRFEELRGWNIHSNTYRAIEEIRYFNPDEENCRYAFFIADKLFIIRDKGIYFTVRELADEYNASLFMEN